MQAASFRQELGWLIIRAVPALMLFLFHGWGKLMGGVGFLQGKEWGLVGFVTKLGLPLPVLFAVCAALAESIFALMLAAGFLTRLSALIVSLNMLVAVTYHVSTKTAFDFAAMYLVCAAVFILVPPGRYSLDELIRSRK